MMMDEMVLNRGAADLTGHIGDAGSRSRFGSEGSLDPPAAGLAAPQGLLPVERLVGGRAEGGSSSGERGSAEGRESAADLGAFALPRSTLGAAAGSLLLAGLSKVVFSSGGEPGSVNRVKELGVARQPHPGGQIS
jgi:hypothetical protein